MHKLDVARSSLESGGMPQLVRVTRKWLAAIIYPGPMPQPARRTSATKSSVTTTVATTAAVATAVVGAPVVGTPARAEAKHSAESVTQAQALAWFEKRRPTYERLSAVVAPYVDRTGVFLDVGANIGYFTKVLGEATGFRGTVHLFEPVPNLAELCRATLLDTPFTSNVHEFGLSDEDASVDIFIAASGNLGWNTIVAEKAATGMTALRIQVRAFETAGIDVTPSFIKIDVEGAEYKVLRGMLGAIERWEPRPAILCEIGWGQGHPAWDQELEVFRSLEKLGYCAYDLDRRPMNIDDLQATTDILLLPSQVI